MSPQQLESTYAEGCAALHITLSTRARRSDSVRAMLDAIPQTQEAWKRSCEEERCPDCGAAAYQGCRPDCLGDES